MSNQPSHGSKRHASNTSANSSPASKRLNTSLLDDDDDGALDDAILAHVAQFDQTHNQSQSNDPSNVSTLQSAPSRPSAPFAPKTSFSSAFASLTSSAHYTSPAPSTTSNSLSTHVNTLLSNAMTINPPPMNNQQGANKKPPNPHAIQVSPRQVGLIHYANSFRSNIFILNHLNADHS